MPSWLTRWISDKTPTKKDLLAVYSVSVFFVYSWTLFSSFYRMPSWLFAHTFPEILSFYAYAFTVNFIESILLLILVLAWDFSLLFFLRDKRGFQTRAVLLAAAVMISVIEQLVSYGSYETIDLFLKNRSVWWLVTVTAGSLVSAIVSRLGWVRGVLEGFAERASIFMYIYLPLAALSVAVVLYRNIF